MKSSAVAALVLLGTTLLHLTSARTVGVFMATPDASTVGTYSAYVDPAPSSPPPRMQPTYSDDPRIRRAAQWQAARSQMHSHIVGMHEDFISRTRHSQSKGRRNVRSGPNGGCMHRSQDQAQIWRAIKNMNRMIRRTMKVVEQTLTLQHIQQTQLQVHRRIRRAARRARRTVRRLLELTKSGQQTSKEARIIRGRHIKSRLQLLDLRQLALTLRSSWERIAGSITPTDNRVRAEVEHDTMVTLKASEHSAKQATAGDGTERKILNEELAKLQRFTGESKRSWKSKTGANSGMCANAVVGKMHDVRRQLGGLKPEDAFYRHPWFSLTSPQDKQSAENLLKELASDTVTWAHNVLEDLELAQLERIARDLKLTAPKPNSSADIKPARHVRAQALSRSEPRRNGHFLFQVREDTGNRDNSRFPENRDNNRFPENRPPSMNNGGVRPSRPGATDDNENSDLDDDDCEAGEDDD